MTYLKSIGVNEAYGETYVYKQARKCKKDSNIISSNLFDHLRFPVHWSCGITLDQCIDTPMHQIFQGVVKSIMEKTIEWLASNYKAFGDIINPKLTELHDLGINWCRMEKLMRGRNYTLGGWQAEQYVAFSRCISIFYGSIRDIVGDKELGIDEHECTIQSLLCLITRLMSNKLFDSKLLLNYTKVFLSSCDMFENKAYLMNGDDTMWYSKGNFLSLLNLPCQVAKFGNVRMYWEGTRERSIQQIKPFLINIRHTSSYFKTKLTYMYVNETLDTINKEIIASATTSHTYDSSTHYEKYSSFKIYGVHENVADLIASGKVISALYISLNESEHKFYICKRTDSPRTCVLFQILFNDKEGFNKCGMWYAPISLAVFPVRESWSQPDIDAMADDYVILCPCISANDSFRLSYAVISRSWKYRNKHNDLSLPLLSQTLFELSIE